MQFYVYYVLFYFTFYICICNQLRIKLVCVCLGLSYIKNVNNQKREFQEKTTSTRLAVLYVSHYFYSDKCHKIFDDWSYSVFK